MIIELEINRTTRTLCLPRLKVVAAYAKLKVLFISTNRFWGAGVEPFQCEKV